MAQSKKRSSSRSHASSRTASSARSTKSANASAFRPSENVVNFGSDAVRDFLSTGAGEAQKAHEKVFAIGREGADNFARSADAATKTLNEAIVTARENVEACVECGNIATTIGKSVGAEILSFANQTLAQNVEISKEIFSCRTANDLFELQSRLVKSNLDNFFTQSARLSEMFFQIATDAAEPLNERLVNASERFSRTLAA